MIKKQEPEMFEQLSAPFNYKPEVDLIDQVSTLCLQRMDQCREGLQAGIDDAAMLIQGLKPPVSKFEPHHPEKKIWYSNWLDLQQGQEAPMVLRQCAEQLWILHENYETAKAMPESANKGLVAGVGIAAQQAPSALGMAALQGAQGGEDQGQAQEQAHEAEQAHHDREQEALLHLSDQQHEKEAKAMEIAGQAHITRLQGENAVRSAEIAGRNAVKVAKARPRTPSKAA